MWYRNLNFWSVLVAGLALFLSQLPPIVEWLPKHQLRVTTASKIGLNSNLGLLNYQIHAFLSNEGNRDIEISKLELQVIDSSGKSITYVGDSYQDYSANSQFPITYPVSSIKIKSNSSWTNQVNFNKKFTNEQEKEFQDIRLKLVAEITEFRQTRGVPAHIMVEANPDTVNQAKDLFDNNIKNQLGIGRFKAKIIAYGNNQGVIGSHSFSFHIYEYHKDIFDSQKEDFKYGQGILGPVNYIKYAWVNVE